MVTCSLSQWHGLRLICVIPRFPDQDGRLSEPPNLIGRVDALAMLRQAGGDRVGVYGLENEAGTPVYVHAKVCIIDDTWVTIGSDNFNRRSWTHDSELTCAIMDETAGSGRVGQEAAAGGPSGFAARLRATLADEHHGGQGAADADGLAQISEAFRVAAARLDEWHADGRRGVRPPGRLRGYPDPRLSAWTRAWARLAYKVIYDPDGRPRAMRRAGAF